MNQDLLTLTPAAAARVRDLLKSRAADARGLRLAVRTTGCSGFSYQLDFAREIRPEDEVIESGGVRIVVDPKSLGLVKGTQLDWIEDTLGAQFVFKNPNEKGRCGCGESFTV